MLDDGRAEDFEEEVLVRLFLAPQLLGFALELRPGADGDEDHATRRRPAASVACKPLADERHAVDADRAVCDFEALGLAGVDPRPAVLGVPGAGPVGQFARPVRRAPSRADSRAAAGIPPAGRRRPAVVSTSSIIPPPRASIRRA